MVMLRNIELVRPWVARNPSQADALIQNHLPKVSPPPPNVDIVPTLSFVLQLVQGDGAPTHWAATNNANNL